jgi:predicted transposase YdaD
MVDSDNSLKQLFTHFPYQLVPWLLNVDHVTSVDEVSEVLPASTLRADTVFRVTLPDQRTTLLHIEYQGRRSDTPMRLRMLDYLSRLAQQIDSHLCSVVLYVGHGAGRHDDGQHQITGPDGAVTLHWRYRVIRLWEMTPEDLLASGQVAALPLIGLTRLAEADPQRVLPETVRRIVKHEDQEERRRILTLLVSLLQQEEMTHMVERLIEQMDEDLLLDTPFLRRIRQQSLEQGVKQGIEQGIERGVERGLRDSILDVLVTRLEISVPAYRRIESQLAQIDDAQHLRQALRAAACAATVEAFESDLSALLPAGA